MKKVGFRVDQGKGEKVYNDRKISPPYGEQEILTGRLKTGRMITTKEFEATSGDTS